MSENDEKDWTQHILDAFPSPRGSYERTDPDYAERVDTRNLSIYSSLETSGERNNFYANLPSGERTALRRRLEAIESFRLASAEELTSKRPPETFMVELGTLNRELADYLHKNPNRLHDLSPRQFEELVADILKDMGCEIEITKRTRDGGRDIFAAFPSPFGRLLAIIECKRYRADRPVGLDLVERFLWVVDRKDNSSCGLVATTSYFSPEVHALARQLPYRLKLRDFQGIRSWLGNFGTWVRDDRSELWVPNS